MSEPKSVAKKTEQIAPGIHHFRIHDDRIDHGSDGLALVDGSNVVLIDPLPIDPAALKRLGTVGAIILTATSHQRSAWRYRRETRAKVYAPEGMSGTEERADVTYKDGDALPGGLRAVAAPGPKEPHYVLHREARPSLLYCGDLLMHEPKGIVFLPDKYLEDPDKARASARSLTDRRFEIIAFAHGAPISRDAAVALRAALGKDEASRGRA